MTTRDPKMANRKRRERFVLPDPPEGEPEDMTSFDHLARNGGVHHLAQHLGNPGTTIVAGERYITRMAGTPASERWAPALLVAFGADPEAYREKNGYVISEQGKPPDFVLEIASRSTGEHDVVRKRVAYADLGIPEYWRFDETGDFHGTRLAGDRLEGTSYEPIPIETVEEGVLQGPRPYRCFFTTVQKELGVGGPLRLHGRRPVAVMGRRCQLDGGTSQQLLRPHAEPGGTSRKACA